MTDKDVSLNRRQALRVGAYVAGAAWVVPAVTVLGAGSASADSPSGHVVPPVKPPVKPRPSGTPEVPEVLGTQHSRPPQGQVQAQQRSALAYTGQNVLGPAAVGAGLVAGGIGLRMAGRRRTAMQATGPSPEAHVNSGHGD